MTENIESQSKSFRFRRGLSSWMVPPAAHWRLKSTGAFVASGLFWPMNLLVLILFFIVIISVSSPFITLSILQIASIQAILAFSGIGLMFVMVTRTQRNLLEPLTHMRYWAMRMRGGHLLARIPDQGDCEFSELAKDINSLGESLHQLTTDMKEQVRIQTERTEQKSHSLRVLYDVATSINNSNNVNDLLTRFLHTLKDLVHAEAASIRLITDDQQLRLVASLGLEDEFLNRERLIPLNRCDCGVAASEGNFKCQDVTVCGTVNKYPVFQNEKMKMLAVPLKYRGKTLGIYNLFVKDSNLIEADELIGLLNSIGQHLGVAVAKSQLENETKRLALMEERTMLSHELHDSLAQTLASLRFQVHFINEHLKESNNIRAQNELQKLKTGMDKANYELRELLDHFRTPMDKRGLVPALIDMVNSFKRDTGIATYFQDETSNQSLPPEQEVQVLHIIQEALSNVRKHSKARNVRLKVTSVGNDAWHVLIEDDGNGISKSTLTRQPGESIGLNIMQERAEKLGGTLLIDSDESEGTRIEITFQTTCQLLDQNLTNIINLSQPDLEKVS